MKNHNNIIAVVAHKNTKIINNADYGYLLESGHEEAVAVTKTVIEQALFYDLLFRKSNNETIPDLDKVGNLIEKVLEIKIPEKIVDKLAASKMVYFSGRNNGVSEELTLKANGITRKI